jgi:hypothetical protein
MSLFTLRAQVLGEPRSAVTDADGGGVIVTLSGAQHSTRSVRDAIRLSRDHLGPFLGDADRRQKEWGLYVTVAGVAAVYGNWPLLPGPSSPRSMHDELVTRIRREWRGASASSALENALRIIEAYTGSSGRRAA